MERESFMRIVAKKEGVDPSTFAALKIRPYRCLCGGPRCIGWQMVHDRFVLQSVADGVISAAEKRAYQKKLGKSYDTTPWIFSCRSVTAVPAT